MNRGEQASMAVERGTAMSTAACKNGFNNVFNNALIAGLAMAALLAPAAAVAAAVPPPDVPPVVLDGGQALIRHAGLAVLVDPVPDGPPLPPVDLVLLRACGPAARAWLERQQLDRAVAVLADGACAAELRGLGVRRLHALRLWDAYSRRKGATFLSVTAMPGAAAQPPGMPARQGQQARPPAPVGKPAQAEVPGESGALIDIRRAGRAPLRIYVGGEAGDDDVRMLPQRFPGAGLAIVRRGGQAMLYQLAPPRGP